MVKYKKRDGNKHSQLPKTPTFIKGFDEITFGGLPKGRPTLVAGGPGSGKTLFSMEFLVRGALENNEPGVFVSFEEKASDLVQNVTSLGFDLNDLVKKKKLMLDYVQIEKNEIEETGEYDLEGLFIRLGNAIDSIGAKRVVLDTIESLFAGLSNYAIVRSELRRLFNWLKVRGVTVVITGEKGDHLLTRQGLEEYVSDCVIFLDHRIENQVSTRRLRIIKYRGTTHGTNEYPFLIDEEGFAVFPVTSLKLDHSVRKERVSSGIPRLDTMLGGKGFYKGSSILVSGTAGTGKTSLAATFSAEVCRQNGKVLYFSFEESPQQIIRNMESIGIDLSHWVKKGLLTFQADRPSLHGLEQHLVSMHKLIGQIKPSAVVIDPISSLMAVGLPYEVYSMMIRLIDFLKGNQITAFLTDLSKGSSAIESTKLEISSLIDTWILFRDSESNGERNRVLYILKSRGMAHSNQLREFLISSRGIELRDVYLGAHGVLTGSARYFMEAYETAMDKAKQLEVDQIKRDIDRKRKSFEAKIAALRADFESETEELANTLAVRQEETRQAGLDKGTIAKYRKADVK